MCSGKLRNPSLRTSLSHSRARRLNTPNRWNFKAGKARSSCCSTWSKARVFSFRLRGVEENYERLSDIAQARLFRRHRKPGRRIFAVLFHTFVSLWVRPQLTANHRKENNVTNHHAAPLELHQPDEGIFQHAKAVLVFQTAANNAAGVHAPSLVFYNPVFTPEVELNGERRPLAADYTMPWAMLLSRTRPLFKTRWPALMHPGETSRPRRLNLMEPYSPDRIPFIMVHGLRSTPLAWQQLTNELFAILKFVSAVRPGINFIPRDFLFSPAPPISATSLSSCAGCWTRMAAISRRKTWWLSGTAWAACSRARS